MQEWNQAYEKVEHYLRAHRIDSRIHRARLIQRILAAVADRLPAGDRLEPGGIETLAIEASRQMMRDWFQDLLTGAARPPHEEQLEIQARIALLVSDAGVRWPYAFMEKDGIPEEMRRAIGISSIRAGPELSVSHMVPRSMDMGVLPDIASQTMATFARWPWLKLLTLWGGYLLILATLFYLTR